MKKTNKVHIPGLWSTGWSRLQVEGKSFYRDKRSMIFIFSYPIVLLVLFSSLFHGTIQGTHVDIRQFFVAGMMASGIFGLGFSTLALRISVEQENGTLQRLAGTPMPKGAYFVGKLGVVLIAALGQTVFMLAVGVMLCGITLPSTVGSWLTFTWVFLLGICSCSLLGIAFTRIIKNAKSASAVVMPPFLVLQFISGIFFVSKDLPRWLRIVAALFPLRWMAQGFRSVFLPNAFALREPTGTWDRSTIALVLALWTVGAFLVCVLTFRWRSRRVG